MTILKAADLFKALNLNPEDIEEIKQIADNKIHILWTDGISQVFKTNKSVKLTNNRLPNSGVCFDL